MSIEWEFPGLTERIHAWLQEDFGTGDVTTNSTIPSDHMSKGIIHAKEAGILAGIGIAEAVFRVIDSNVNFRPCVQDSETLQKGTVIAEIEGKSRSILLGERLALNLLQRMSGIATRTQAYVQAIGDLPVSLVDTRKTTPGHRMLEKYAVRVGGGKNHRFGLHDAVMIKDNHIKASGGITSAVRRARAAIPHTMKIEVEVESLDQVREAIAAGADIIMLDNMSFFDMKTAVSVIREQSTNISIEASGGVTLETIRQFAETGVDVISVGALTSSVQTIDISLDLNEKKGFRQ